MARVTKKQLPNISYFCEFCILTFDPILGRIQSSREQNSREPKEPETTRQYTCEPTITAAIVRKIPVGLFRITEEVKRMKYNLSKIMKRAWKNFRKEDNKITFAEALHRSWLSAKAEVINAERIENAKTAAGIKEEVNTWAAWKKAGYEVIHGSKALFQTVLIWGSRGDNATYKASFFARSQVEEIATAA